MALELTWQVFEHATLPASSLRGKCVGVFIGSSNNDYQFPAVSDPTVAHPYAITGTASSIIANRVSYFYDFRGPSVAVDTALELAGLGALPRAGAAQRRVRRGRSCAANDDHHDPTIGFERQPAGCWPPTAASSPSPPTTTATPGAKAAASCCSSTWPTPDATATKSWPWCAERPSTRTAVTAGITAPNGPSQGGSVHAPGSLARAGQSRRNRVEYVEAHGTGTPLGDPIEVQALQAVQAGRPAEGAAIVCGLRQSEHRPSGNRVGDRQPHQSRADAASRRNPAATQPEHD